jgi:glycerol-3-phosphate dehydrogenase
MREFSALKRNELVRELSEEKFELLVIGGGITGAGIALDAVSRGLKTALVEKMDFAWGTSSRSTKLIHGGLRYLKQLELGLVKEVSRERLIVRKNARHLVQPARFLLPIRKGGNFSKWSSSMGLRFYDWLADVQKRERRKMLNREEVLALEPLLERDGLKGGGLFYEYCTDDARLTIEILKRAFDQGATILNYAEVTGFTEEVGKITGVHLKDHISGASYGVKSTVVINATGPWVDQIRQANEGQLNGKKLRLTKGIHIVVAKERLPLRQAVYFDVMEDQRMVFAIPKNGVTYVGTTDTDYAADIDRPVANAQDVRYLLDAVNSMFSEVHLQEADILSSWTGLRSLIQQRGKRPSELSRKDEIFISENGLISIAGGKLSGYRKMAERAVDAAINRIGDAPVKKRLGPCVSQIIKIAGSEFSDEEHYHQVRKDLQKRSELIGVQPDEIDKIFNRYGTNAEMIVGKAHEYLQKKYTPGKSLLFGELWYGIHHESVQHLNDFLIRRTGRLYFERPYLRYIYPAILEEMAAILGWSEDEKSRMKREFKIEYESSIRFPEIKNS